MVKESKPIMEAGFEAADSVNLPRMDCFTVAAYLVTLPKPETQPITSKSTKERYGDDAIGYVQLARDSGLCILKARVCPEPETHTTVTLTLNEIKQEIVSIQCDGCEAGSWCMHGPALLLWLHRRSEEPDFRHRECYWRKPWMAEFKNGYLGIIYITWWSIMPAHMYSLERFSSPKECDSCNIGVHALRKGDDQPVKFITVKQLTNAKSPPKIESNPDFLKDFLAEAKKRNLDTPFIRHLSAELPNEENN